MNRIIRHFRKPTFDVAVILMAIGLRNYTLDTCSKCHMTNVHFNIISFLKRSNWTWWHCAYDVNSKCVHCTTYVGAGGASVQQE